MFHGHEALSQWLVLKGMNQEFDFYESQYETQTKAAIQGKASTAFVVEYFISRNIEWVSALEFILWALF